MGSRQGLDYEMPAGESLEERSASTLELMKRGAKLIYQGVLLQPAEVGIPDLLERVPGRSKFGKYFYRPIDIKVRKRICGSGEGHPAS